VVVSVLGSCNNVALHSICKFDSLYIRTIPHTESQHKKHTGFCRVVCKSENSISGRHSSHSCLAPSCNEPVEGNKWHHYWQ